jgi:hypothetical protein
MKRCGWLCRQRKEEGFYFPGESFFYLKDELVDSTIILFLKAMFE